MQETIDLIAHRELRNLRRFTRETGQPTSIDQLDLEPMVSVQNIDIDEEHITIKYNEKIERKYNANAHSHREWVFKYNDDPEIGGGDPRRHRPRAQAPLRPAGKRRVPAGLRGMLQRLRAVRQPRRRATDRRSLRHDVRRGDERVRRPARVGRRLQRRLAEESQRRHRRQVRVPQGSAVREVLLRDLRSAAARLRCVHADRLRRRRHVALAPRRLRRRGPVPTEARKRRKRR